MSELDTVLTAEDKETLNAAAHGVINLMAAADPGPISSTKVGATGGKALTTITGPIGHLLAENKNSFKFKGTHAEVADQVLATVTEAVTILKTKAPRELDDFRRAITTITAAATGANPKPAVTEITQQINAALDA
jgi:hypothetical protein